MFELDSANIGRRARVLGYNRDLYEKVCRIAHILRLFEQDEQISTTLALKGGTAINLTVFDLPRLSVDIDLDLCGNLPLDEMMEVRAAVLGKISKMLSSAGYVLGKRARKSHALDSLTLEYVNGGKTRDNLKIDINCVMRCHLYPAMSRRVLPQLIEGDLNVMCVHLIEMFAGKIVALLLRSAARDLYDTYMMIKKGVFLGDLIPALRKAVIFYLAIGTDSRTLGLSFVRTPEMGFRDYKTALRPVLNIEDSFEPKYASAIVGDFLKGLLTVDEGESAFLEGFRKGEYCPDALFSDPEIVERIRNHPMAIYKCSLIGNGVHKDR